MPTPRSHRFAEFTFTPDTGELVGPAGRVRLEPQPARLLAILIERAGEMVTRDELRVALWADRAVEADQGINYCVREIRAALGDEAQGPRFIETLPRRGYRFVPALIAESEVGTATSAVMRRDLRRRMPQLLASAGVLIVALVALVMWTRPRMPVPPRWKIAVLPFRTQGVEAGYADINRQFTMVLVERLTNDTIGNFDVVGPVTTGRLATDPRPHTELGKELGVDLILSGGIDPRDSTMIMQVVRVTDGIHVAFWRGRVLGRPLGDAALEVLKQVHRKIPASPQDASAR